jgi:hypothetical protein
MGEQGTERRLDRRARAPRVERADAPAGADAS